ncbi:CD97 antigen [Exaiptasia diaphana]|uniref:G-protein coupled receptors family 2 profile 2 domain-containing protein n=1 Tax=Exaiptasia diaphana TaxID=2652724 RepID=A0A913YTW1_EXADI|nr:CD97 antigen [Exaiptasia diaphana]
MSTKHEVYQCGTQEIEITVKRNFCWLNGGFWIYNGPVLGILLVNFVLFVVFLNIAYGKLSQRFADNKLKKARKCIKCVAALLPLLGLVWLFGYTVNLHWILAYIFIVINSSQGIMIAIFHCVLDDQVKAILKSKFKQRRRLKNKEMVVQGNVHIQFEEKEQENDARNKEG